MSSPKASICPNSPRSPLSPRIRSPRLKRALSGVGKATLLSETNTNRSIFACVLLLDSLVSFKTIKNRLNAKLLSFDRFASLVSEDGQYFEVIKKFDSAECMDETTTTHGEIDIHVFIEDILSNIANVPFTDRLDKPLWRLHLYHFQHSKQTAIVIRCHHCICDGITFGFIFHNICDDTLQSTSTNESSSSSSLSSSSSSSSNASTSTKKKKKQSIFALIVSTFAFFIGILIVLYRLLMFSITSTPQTIFKPTLSERKLIGYISEGINLKKLNEKRKSIELKHNKKYATFNDFMLAIIAESVALYLQKKNEFIPKYVHVGTPVNIRKKNSNLNTDKDVLLGNKIGTYIVKMPLSADMNFVDKLNVIKEEFDLVKKTPEAKMSFYVMKLSSKLPAFIRNYIGQKTTSGLTLVVSNVRGADNMYFCGAHIVDLLGIVPPPMGVALGYAVFSYDGKVVVTVNVDRNCYDEQSAKELILCLKEVLKKEGCI